MHIACVHAGPAKSLVHQLKFSGVKEAAEIIGRLIYLSTNLDQYQALVPIPIHPEKEKVRGFNQAELIGRALAQELQIPLLPLIEKVAPGKSQLERQAKNARLRASRALTFSLNHSFTKSLPSSILLIDDVVTTGTTLQACGEVLAQAGVNKIEAVVFAHSI